MLLCGALHAQVYWNGIDSDVWDTDTTANWNTAADGTDSNITFSAGDAVVFSSDTATQTSIKVSSQQVASELTVLSGQDITINNGSVYIGASGSGTTMTINVESGASLDMGYSNTSSVTFDIDGDFSADVFHGGGSMTKNGSGTSTFNRLDATLTINGGKLVYTGTEGAKLKNTTVNSGGTLELTGSAFDGTKRDLKVNGTGVVEFASGLDQTISIFSGDGSLVGNGSTLRVGGDNKSTTFNGDISGDMDLHAIGSGTFTMSNTTSMEIVVAGNGVNNSILGTGNINLDGELTFDLTSADLTAGNSWLIVDVANLNETFGATFSIADFTESGGIWTYDLNALVEFSELTGELYVIPEPSTFALLAGCLGLAVVMLKRRL